MTINCFRSISSFIMTINWIQLFALVIQFNYVHLDFNIFFRILSSLSFFIRLVVFRFDSRSRLDYSRRFAKAQSCRKKLLSWDYVNYHVKIVIMMIKSTRFVFKSHVSTSRFNFSRSIFSHSNFVLFFVFLLSSCK